MSEPLRGDLTASEHPPKGPAPLHLGTGENVALTAYQHREQAFLRTNGELAALSTRGAVELAEWLADFAGVRLPTIWGAREIAAHYGVTARSVSNWRKHPQFPRARELAAGPVWEARAVRAWVRKYRRGPGRPPDPARHA